MLFTPKPLFPVKIGFGQHFIYQTKFHDYTFTIDLYRRKAESRRLIN